MKRWWVLLVVWVIAILQGYFISGLSGSLLVPNLLLLVVLGVAVTRELRLSLLAAAWGGFWLDVASMNSFGLRMIWLVLFVLLVFRLKGWGLEFKRPAVMIIVLAAALWLYNLTLFIEAAISSGQLILRPRLAGVWLIETLVVGGLAWLFGERLQLLLKPKGLT
ncbi:rod shape-determining protein MreD [Candidatus Microgenomates bacterium]|nr:rod shape-determining protein MreD [Candidatus Microgenomates bacterium]